MAVEMVRQPSETPNIENVDDFMPIRYAYANQNGYVIGRGAIGTGIDTDAYTINGNNFIINSGRLVIQGVECDIKNEHPIVIDINASKRYYAVYLEVNLENNTSEIFITHDELGTPVVPAGDDLTINPIGFARMVLFTFEATNGIISNVVKVVKACEYMNKETISNSSIANNDGTYSGFNQNEDKVLRSGDDIVLKKRELWAGNWSFSRDDYVITLPQELKDGDTLMVEYIVINPYTNKRYNSISFARVNSGDECSMQGSGVGVRVGSERYYDIAPIIVVNGYTLTLKGGRMYFDGGSVLTVDAGQLIGSIIINKISAIIQ